MLLKKTRSTLWMTVTALLLLSACGRAAESELLGNWKAVAGEEVSMYFTISEDRFSAREGSDDTPDSIEYIFTETYDENFTIEVINPDGTVEFLFEGFFEDRDTIAILDNPDDDVENAALIRVDNLAEEMERNEEIQREEEAMLEEEREKELAIEEEQRLVEEEEQLKEDKKASEIAIKERRLERERDKELAEEEEKEEEEKLREEEEELAKEEEERLDAEKEEELLKEEEKKEQEAAENESLEEEAEPEQEVAAAGSKNKYMQKADGLEEEIMDVAKERFVHDTENGFYGEYYYDWDDLLNEVWAELKNTMPESEFETLKQKQIEWIQMKEKNFDERPKEPASERASGMDYLANVTSERTYYLIENYLK